MGKIQKFLGGYTMHSHVLGFRGQLDNPTTLKHLNAFKIQYLLENLIRN